MANYALSPDPLVRALRATFGANVVRVPEKRVKPLAVIAARKGRVALRGTLNPILQGRKKFDIPRSAKATSRMADLRDRQSKNVSIDLGLDIMDNFLAGFGVPTAGINAHLSGATDVAFSFHDVHREWIDVNWLGRALAGRAIDRQNPAASIYFRKPKWQLLVVDSIIVSSDFTIAVTKSKTQSFKLDIPAIQETLGNLSAKVTVDSASGKELTFRGPDRLTFAFTAVHPHIADDGSISALPPGDTSTVLANQAEGTVVTYGLNHVELSDQDAMIEWDEFE